MAPPEFSYPGHFQKDQTETAVDRAEEKSGLGKPGEAPSRSTRCGVNYNRFAVGRGEVPTRTYSLNQRRTSVRRAISERKCFFWEGGSERRGGAEGK